MSACQSEPVPPAKFDAYAEQYEILLARSVAGSGETPAYFADYKMACLERVVGAGFDQPVLDYGCGTGSLTRRLALRFREVHGFDPSSRCLEQARQLVPGGRFHRRPETIPDQYFGLAVLSGVLHHVRPAERPALMRLVARKLRPEQGRVVVFEHNPLNPLTRRAVASCPFDDDAVLLWPRALRRLLIKSGFQRVSSSFIVFFPRSLRWLRWLEPHLGWLPLGAQQMVVARAGALDSAEDPGNEPGSG